VVAGAGDYSGTDDMMVVVVAGFVCNAAASIDFSSSGAGATEALPDNSKPRTEDFLQTTKEQSHFINNYEPTEYNSRVLGYLQCGFLHVQLLRFERHGH
jgi:hypothetical protein